MTAPPPASPRWVPLTEGIQFNRAWLAGHTPELYENWARAAGGREKRVVAAQILRTAADMESDEDPTPAGDHQLAVWAELADHLVPDLTAGSDWLPLAAALTRAAATGYDVPARLPQLVYAAPLPSRHPARELHFRLLDDCAPAAAAVT